MIYDSIIIGTGPAGLSAALNLKTYQKDFLWFGSARLSDKVQKAEKITNYPGFPAVSGRELFDAFDQHRKAAGLEITEKTVTTIGASGGSFMVLADNDIYQAKTLILCMGVMAAKQLEGEERLLGRGLSYCATCDGMLYKGKTIAVICNDPKYEHEVEYLAGLAAKVYYIPSFKGSMFENTQESSADGTNAAEASESAGTSSAPSNVILLKGSPAALKGENKVEALLLRNGEELPVDGVFALRNAIAPSTLMPGLAVDNGHIVTDRSCCTNIPGCFAAGDCTGRPYQYTKAVGEGNVAAHSCISYLAAQKSE